MLREPDFEGRFQEQRPHNATVFSGDTFHKTKSKMSYELIYNLQKLVRYRVKSSEMSGVRLMTECCMHCLIAERQIWLTQSTRFESADSLFEFGTVCIPIYR